jgi:hypothetical protein
MSIKDRINEDLKTAMKAKDALKVSVIRLVKAAVKNEEIERGRELDDGEVTGIIQREIKRRRESIGEFKKGNRPDLVQKEEAEEVILYGYLPAQADVEEIRQVVRGILDEIPAGTKINLGMIMPGAIEKLKGRADGKGISAVVKEEMEKGAGQSSAS